MGATIHDVGAVNLHQYEGKLLGPYPRMIPFPLTQPHDDPSHCPPVDLHLVLTNWMLSCSPPRPSPYGASMEDSAGAKWLDWHHTKLVIILKQANNLEILYY